MTWSVDQIQKGHEKMVITCDGCGRKVVRTAIGNALVGRQRQLVCTECGHRGASLLRVYCEGPAPTAETIPHPGAKKAGPLSEPGLKVRGDTREGDQEGVV
jgi:DNA-directed RNA polymerase subunit RPC12/RpoP